jgi:hypothetical protein
MPARPPILSIGTVSAERLPNRLYLITMKNGHRAFGVIPRTGPRCESAWQQRQVRVAYSPFDMSRCRIVEWLDD